MKVAYTLLPLCFAPATFSMEVSQSNQNTFTLIARERKFDAIQDITQFSQTFRDFFDQFPEKTEFSLGQFDDDIVSWLTRLVKVATNAINEQKSNPPHMLKNIQTPNGRIIERNLYKLLKNEFLYFAGCGPQRLLKFIELTHYLRMPAFSGVIASKFLSKLRDKGLQDEPFSLWVEKEVAELSPTADILEFLLERARNGYKARFNIDDLLALGFKIDSTRAVFMGQHLTSLQGLQNIPHKEKISDLDLRYNPIVKIEARHLDGLSELETLDLSMCNISLIEKEAFQKLNSLKNLYIHWRNASPPDLEVFNGLSSLEVLEIFGIWGEDRLSLEEKIKSVAPACNVFFHSRSNQLKMSTSIARTAAFLPL